MRTRAPKPPRDPLAPDAIERYLDRHGPVRLLVVTAAMAATFVIAGMAAIAFLTSVLITAEQVAPSVPSAVLDLVAPAPAPTDHIGPAVATIEPTQAPVRPDSTAPSPLAPPMSAPGAAVPPPALSPTRPSLATARGAAPAAPWASSVLTSAAPAAKTPPSEPAAAPMAAPAARPTVAPTTSPSATAPTATSAPAPAPSMTTTAPPTASERGKGPHHKRCTPRKHRKGKC